MAKNAKKIENLAEREKNVHNATSFLFKGAVNQLLTIRNWAIGCYIVEYEQEGCDRAKYGARLLQNLADKLSIKGLDRQLLNACRMFYVKYPQICATASHKLRGIDFFPGKMAFIEKNSVAQFARQCLANSKRRQNCL